MSFDWKGYVGLAEELLKESEESCLRSSISRAYYGVFCIVRNKKGYKNYTGGNVHQKVINEYKSSVDKSEQNIGRILDNLRRSRNNADYNEDETISKDLAERSLISAKRILESIESP